MVGDIADTALLTKTLKAFRADAVMHFAAATYVGESVENPEYHYRNNIVGTLSLLNAMRAAEVGRMLFSSTCATYGMTESETMSEATPQAPFSPSGWGSRTASPGCIPTTITRCSLTYAMNWGSRNSWARVRSHWPQVS